MARVAHELTTPVTLISGSLENLQESLASLLRYVEATEKYLGDAEEITRLRLDLRLDHRMRDTAGLLEICAEGARRLSHVVAQLRSQAAPPARAGGHKSDLRSIIDTAVAMASHGRTHRPLVVTDCLPSQISLSGNPQSLGQVLLNVVRNAFDAIEGQRDGRVDIEARLHEPKRQCAAKAPLASICIRDNGPGVPADLREHIFDEGVSSKAQHGGLGLGLPISRDIMIAMGGRLDLLPSSRGAKFLIEVPVAATCGSTPHLERRDL